MEFKQKDILNITISGGCGRISFELIPLICNGLVFGNKQKICLNLYGNINKNNTKYEFK
jgi:hypothetical protein